MKKVKLKKDWITCFKAYKEWRNGLLKLHPAIAQNSIGQCRQKE